jgi:hypothetical protein
MSTIRVTAFQPFESRAGIDTVLALAFEYDAGTVADLKAAIGRARYSVGAGNLGGWLGEHRCWFVERDAWPIVRQCLQAAGHRLVGPEANEPGPGRSSGSSVVDVRSAVKSWYREMTRKYHPDRTLDNGAAMKAINHAYERLQELLSIER